MKNLTRSLPLSYVPTSEYIVRPVTADSVNADLGPGSHIPLPEVYTEGLPEAIAAGTISFYVAATATGEAVGRIGVNWQGPGRTPELIEELPGVPNVAFMEVDKGHRRHGLGRALLRAALNEAEERRHDRVFLSVRVADDAYPARELYRQEGFVPWSLGTLVVETNVLDEATGTYQAGEHEVIIMTKDLTQD